jgi:hypothetical protein
MKIIHHFKSPGLAKNVKKNTAFCLVNDRQDFVNFYETTQSRYEGFFVKNEKGYKKIFSRVSVEGEPLQTINMPLFSLVGRKYQDFFESYYLKKDEPIIIYELSRKKDFIVRLDARDIFKIPEWGRAYEVEVIEGGFIIKYVETGEAPFYITILTDGSIIKHEAWKKVAYPRDAQRNSRPSHLYEFELGKFSATYVLFAYGNSAENSLALANKYFGESKIRFLREEKHSEYKGDKKSVELASFFAQKTLNDLWDGTGLLAGLPWFTSCWSRDELLSLPALSEEKAKKIIRKYLKTSWPEGQIPVIIGSSHLSSDSLGILCWAIIASGIKLSLDERILFTTKLLEAITELEKKENLLGFVYSGPNQSWMDSIPREGYLIEIQALYVKMLEMAYFLTKDHYYDQKRTKLIKNIRTYFLHDFKGRIADRLGESLVRPNIFLAHFFAPELLTKKEWEKCFDIALPKLWLSWGGLTSVDKNFVDFVPKSTGENNLSYHNGDSWFFINNIAAHSMSAINRIKYAKYTKRIIKASTEEILWNNFIGRPGEISSAQQLESWGCGLQAFSAATYLYLVKKLQLKNYYSSPFFEKEKKSTPK